MGAFPFGVPKMESICEEFFDREFIQNIPLTGPIRGRISRRFYAIISLSQNDPKSKKFKPLDVIS